MKKTTKAKTFWSSIFHLVTRKQESSIESVGKKSVRFIIHHFYHSLSNLLVNPHDSSRNTTWVCQINKIIVDKKEGNFHFLFEVRLVRRKRLAFTSLQTPALFKLKKKNSKRSFHSKCCKNRKYIYVKTEIYAGNIPLGQGHPLPKHWNNIKLWNPTNTKTSKMVTQYRFEAPF